MKNKHLVSVIIPVFNGEKYLAEAIESVIAQDYRPIEVIVIDDGSIDRSAEIAKSYLEVRYIYQPNRGLSSALNQGIKAARGSFLAFLDADDLWKPDKLSAQLSLIDEHPDLDIVFGNHQRFYSPELGDLMEDEMHYTGVDLPGYLKVTALIRKEAFIRVGLFDTGLKLGDFIDWYSRAIDNNLKVMMLEKVVAMRRIHGDNMTLQKINERSDYIHIIKATLDRRRKKGVTDDPDKNSEGLV